MRIVQITPVVGTGAVGRIVDQLYKGLIESGYKCIVVCGKAGNTLIPEKDLIICGNIRRYLNALNARIFDRDGFCSSFYTRKIVEKIEKFSPDIIQFHGNYGYYIDVRVLYRCINKNNYILVNTLHSCWDFTGHCCYFIYASCEKWMTKCHNCHEKHSYPASWIFDNSKKNYDEKKRIFTSVSREVIVTPSNWLAELIPYSFLQKYPVKIIRNGIDISSFSNKKFNAKKFKFDISKIIILGIAGQWTNRKGLDDFIELSKIVNDEFQIVVVGVNKRQKARLPLNIYGITRTENVEELALLYSIASIFFNPTHEDNYPTVNIEAIACGTPVVTYRTGGSSEIIEITGAGKVVKKGDYQSVINIARKYKGKKLILKREVYKMISHTRMVKDYINLYQELQSIQS